MSGLASRRRHWRQLGRVFAMRMLTVAAGVAAVLQAANTGAQTAAVAPTYAEHVAPILQQRCGGCHRPDGIGPMALHTYQDARRHAFIIKSRVEQRVMPPWHLDRTVGIQEYKNDISLTDDQIATITRWVDAGAPEGDPALAPAPVEWSVGGEWTLAEQLGRPPDFVVRSAPYTVKPNAQDQWWTPSLPFEGLDGPRWVRASEFKPAYPQGTKVVHHGHAQLVQELPDGSRRLRALGRYGVGKPGDIFPDDVGMKIEPGGTVSWNLHYYPIDVEVPNDVVEVGLWFYPKGDEPQLETQGEVRFTVDQGGNMPWAGDIVIPPHSLKAQQGIHVLDRAALVHSFRPHMHMRGKEQSVEAIYPDGRREMLAKVDRYSHIWQISYLFADHVKPLLPVGTTLLFTSLWDNTAANPLNPDPDQWVVFGQRGVDEMSHVWLGMTYLTEEQYDEQVFARGRPERTEGGGE